MYVFVDEWVVEETMAVIEEHLFDPYEHEQLPNHPRKGGQFPAKTAAAPTLQSVTDHQHRAANHHLVEQYPQHPVHVTFCWHLQLVFVWKFYVLEFDFIF